MRFAAAITRNRSSMRGLGSGLRADATTTTWSTLAALGWARGLRSPAARRARTLLRGRTPGIVARPSACTSSSTTSPAVFFDTLVEVPLHILQGQGEQRGERVGGRRTPEQVIRFEVADRPIARVRPAHEQQRRS